jgi:hypothetical protein
MPGFAKVSIVRHSESIIDEHYTKQLCEQSRDGEYYVCRKCSFRTLDCELFINHMAEEINNAMTSLSDLYNKLPPKAAEP